MAIFLRVFQAVDGVWWRGSFLKRCYVTWGEKKDVENVRHV
jgi:hypothetical protein